MDHTAVKNQSSELAAHLANSDAQSLRTMIADWSSEDIAWAIAHLSEDQRCDFLRRLDPEDAAEILECMSSVQAVELVKNLEADAAANIVQQLPSNAQADLLGELSSADAEAILESFDPAQAQSLRLLSAYSDEEAGGLMITEFLSYNDQWTVAQVVDDLRGNADFYRDMQVQYAFVVDTEKSLQGVLRLRDLLLAKPNTKINSLMIKSPLTVFDHTSLDDLRQFFDDHDFLAVPVLTPQSRLIGLVTRASVEEALAERYEGDYRKSQGLVQEELRSMPLGLRSRRRLAWLSINIVLNIVAASVIAVYQETLSQVIALAVFLPIISDMSGCTGNQAVAVSMRELSLGLVHPAELFRVFAKEAAVGLINGTVLGLLIALVAWLYQGNMMLGLVVGVAMAANSLIAVTLGGVLPLLMKKIHMDPALASGPILTTVTDMCGFFIVLSLASLALPYLI